ncbi:MAG: manganese efflux pump MntP [bacterium]
MCVFIINSVLLGVALAMDAFSVSIANMIHEPNMRKGKMVLVAGTYAFFQFIMPLIGWFCVHTITQTFRAIEPLIPWIAFALLLYIGGSMILEGLKGEVEEETESFLTLTVLIIQGIATSIDALSVGFTISEYSFVMAFCACLIIALVTWIICWIGLHLGRRLGELLSQKAPLLGGVILILIGFEILITHFL